MRTPALCLGLLLLSPFEALADYPQEYAKAIAPVIDRNDPATAEERFLKEAQAEGKYQLLALYELGSIYQIMGDFAKSTACLDQADQVARVFAGRAVHSVTGTASKAGAAMIDDQLLTWEGGTFERVLSRTLNALNYLARHDLEGAKVEIKKAEEYQLAERKRTEDNVDAVTRNTMASSSFIQTFAPMYAFVKDARDSRENAFTYYLASQIYRAHGMDGLSDAIIDINRAQHLCPASPPILDAYQELLALGSQAEGSAERKTDPGPRTGTVVVIYQVAFVPRMVEIPINVLLPKGLDKMTCPTYQDFGTAQAPLLIQAGDLRQTTSMVVDLRRLAVKDLEERLPGIISRRKTGAITKVAMFGLLGRAVASLSKSVTHADLHAWLGLPSEIQVAQFRLPEGVTDLVLSSPHGTRRVEAKVTAGGTTFVLVRGVQGRQTVATTVVTP
jgi:hypothetical protein